MNPFKTVVGLGVLGLVATTTTTTASADLVGTYAAYAAGQPHNPFGFAQCFKENWGGVQFVFDGVDASPPCPPNPQWEVVVPMPPDPTDPPFNGFITLTYKGTQTLDFSVLCQTFSADFLGDHAIGPNNSSALAGPWTITSGVGVSGGNGLFGVCTALTPSARNTIVLLSVSE